MARKKKISPDEPKKVVKKRKVGRPKKRGRKKKYYTPKKKKKKVGTKGFSRNLTYNRVRSVLWTNFKDDFPSYRDFISNLTDEEGNKIKGSSIVSRVFEQCKSLDCLDSDIIEIYNQFKSQNPDDDTPVLPPEYYDEHFYWALETEDWWSGFDSRVWVVSPMLLTDPDYFLGILGSDRYVDVNGELLLNRRFDANRGDYVIYGKKERFNEFINWCNQRQSEGTIIGSEQVPYWKFCGREDEDREVYWNPLTARWEVRIVICDSRGNVEDYGFNPSEPDLPVDEDLINAIINRQGIQGINEELNIPAEEPRQGMSEAEIKIREKELEQEDRRLKLEEERSARINKLLERYLDDKIDTETFERLLDKIK